MTLDSQEQTPASSPEAPLVTAIVLCYNHARFVVEALESVRLQNYPNIELVIVDDSSKDASIAVIEEWIQDNRVKCQFLRHEKNQGVCAALNHALQLARGKYIAAFAADDVWLPGKTETQVRLLERSSDRVGVAFSDAIQIDETGRSLPELFIAAHRPMPQIPRGRIFDVIWEGNFIPAMTTMVRRECFQRLGNYDESLAYEDWDMWLRIALEYEFCYNSEPLAKYRLVGSSMVRTRMPAIMESSAKVCLKMIERDVLSREQRSLAGSRLMSYAKARYYDGLSDPGRWLRTALRYKLDGWAVLLLCCTGLGIPHGWVRGFQSRIYQWLARQKLKKG